MAITRRTILGMGAVPAIDDVGMRAQQFVEAWNRWATGMREGIRDVKLERKMREAWRRLEGELEGR